MADEIDPADHLLRNCLSQIESILGWGPANAWSTKDFENLGERIFVKSGVRLSVATLKRIWGTINYDSKPTLTTLNALAKFLDFDNWHIYKRQMLQAPVDVGGVVVKPSSVAFWRRPVGTWLLVVLALIPLISVLYISASSRFNIQPDASHYSFSSRKVVETGVPNTVVFKYDASAASEGDTVAIQQCWDTRLSVAVDRGLRQHTSIYYHPGYFDARLTVNGVTVKQHDLVIKSDGWLPMIDTNPIPVYFTAKDVFQDGYMSLSVEKLRTNVPSLQPQVPWTAFYYVGEFGDVDSDDFVFECELKNDFNAGAAICRKTEVHILFEGGAMVIPLSIPGCVSSLELGRLSGQTKDLSAFGVDLSEWTNVRFVIDGPLATILINHKKALDFQPAINKAKWLGMIFKFQGTGSVDFVKVSRKKDGVVYEENFDTAGAETKQLH